MILRGVLTFYSLVLICFRGVTSLRDVRLIVEPPIVIRGGTAALICYRDMQGTPLYSVKWYRGNHEFYRYTPNELPNTRVFGLPGVYVDMNNSNGSQVLLKRLDLSLAGNFSCEVTAEAPPFSTSIATKYLDIIAAPQKGPYLDANKEDYRPGEVMKANCSSAPARPAANLTIYINDEPHRSSETSLHPSETGLYWTNVKVEVNVTPALFPGDRMRVECVASIYNVYKSTATLDFFRPGADPRPARITYNSASKRLPSWIFLFLMFFLPMVVSQELMYNEDSFDDVFTQYYDEESQNNFISSLVGG